MNRWITPLAVALALSPVAAFAQEAGLIGHWEFSPDRTQNSGMRAVSGKEVSFSGGPRVVKRRCGGR